LNVVPWQRFLSDLKAQLFTENEKQIKQEVEHPYRWPRNHSENSFKGGLSIFSSLFPFAFRKQEDKCNKKIFFTL